MDWREVPNGEERLDGPCCQFSEISQCPTFVPLSSVYVEDGVSLLTFAELER